MRMGEGENPFVLANQIAACRITWAISSESSTVVGAFTLNGRATIVDNRGLCTAMRLTSWMPVRQLAHAKCCKSSQRCIQTIESFQRQNNSKVSLSVKSVMWQFISSNFHAQLISITKMAVWPNQDFPPLSYLQVYPFNCFNHIDLT